MKTSNFITARLYFWSNALKDLTSSKEQPCGVHLEVFYKRHNPCHLEIPFADVGALCVEMAAVYAVGLTEARQAARQSLLVYKRLHHLEVSLLDVEGVLFVRSCPTHRPKLLRTAHPRRLKAF